MKSMVIAATALMMSLAPTLADAGNHKAKSKGNGNGKGAVSKSVGNTRGFSSNCPPGLAKKSPACIPPGQAKKYRVGDYLDGDYMFIQNPERYGLRRGETYYRAGGQVYRVDRETRQVLDLIGAVDAILN